jgi:hypothetical protein
MWFQQLTGFEEQSPEQVRQNLRLEGTSLTSTVNGRRFQAGHLEIPALNELRRDAPDLTGYESTLQLSELVGNVQDLHAEPANAHALFQAASQFNLLEMVSPEVTPEAGIDGYEHDHTQGPACAIAGGAGTIYRNYFVPLGDQIGQTANRQINCLDRLGKQLAKDGKPPWTMQNGYALITAEQLKHINQQIHSLNANQRELLKGELRIGIQWNTEVTLPAAGHLVTQAYCSALPVAYTNVPAAEWESFARIILEATYEATLLAALVNYHRYGSAKVFLTLVGGGVFGNDMRWIIESLEKVLQLFARTPLDIQIVSYGNSNPRVQQLIRGLGD